MAMVRCSCRRMLRKLLVVLLFGLSANQLPAADQFTAIEPDGQYKVTVSPAADTNKRPLIRAVWSDQHSQEEVYEAYARLRAGYGADEDVQCFAVDAKGRVWIACGNHDLEHTLRCLLVLRSPVEPQPLAVTAQMYPGIEGAEQLRAKLNWISQLRTPTGTALLSDAVLRGLSAPEFNTGPGPDVSFPRAPADRERAAEILRTTGVSILNQALDGFAEHHCLYELSTNNFSFRSQWLPVQVRQRMQPLLPIPQDRETWTSWQTRWQALPLQERRIINRLLLPTIFDVEPPGNLLDVNLPWTGRGGVLTFAPNPWRAGSQVTSLLLPWNGQQRRRGLVVDDSLTVLWQSASQPGEHPEWANWQATIAAEAVLDSYHLDEWNRDSSQPPRQISNLLAHEADFGSRAAVVAAFITAHYHHVAPPDQGGFVKDGPDLAGLSAADIQRLGRDELVGWFTLPSGAVFLLQSGRVAICPTGRTAVTLTDRDRLLNPAGRSAFIAQARDVFPPAPAIARTPNSPPTPPFVPATRTMLNPVDGSEMIFIPPGPFLTGSNHVRFPNAGPLRAIEMDGYWISKRLITKGQIARKIGSKRYGDQLLEPAGEPFPLSWQAAADYARWAGGTLPTEAQWEKAIRGTDGRHNVWGASRAARGIHGPLINETPVPDISPYGLTHLFGFASGRNGVDTTSSLWEHCSDQFVEPYPARAMDRNPKGPATGDGHVMRQAYPNLLERRVSDRTAYFRIVLRDSGR